MTVGLALNRGNTWLLRCCLTSPDIDVLERAQRGITEYFRDYISILPAENKKLDEKLLELVNKVEIKDEDFMNLKVEDPFFGRMTDIKDVIG